MTQLTDLVSATTIQAVLNEAMGRGADFAEVFCEDRVNRSASLDDGRVEELSTGAERGAGIRVVVGGTTGFAHTADLSEASLLEAARTAASVARGGSSRTVAVGTPQRHRAHASEGIDATPTAMKLALLTQVDEVARSEGGAIAQVQAGYMEGRRQILVANSDGVFSTDDQVRTRFNVICVASGDTGLQTGFESAAHTRGFEMFEDIDVAEMARLAARRAITKLSARPAPSGELPVVLANAGGVLFHEACGHGLEADHILKDSSVYAGKVGELVASPLVTLVDDGSMTGEWGYASIDDEGHPSTRNVLIENGVLTDYMWDMLRARKQGRAGSGNGRRQSYQHLPIVRMTNTFVMEGTQDPEEIVAQTTKGVYVAKLGGGQVNTATGDFVFGTTEAYLIENGEITAPIRDVNMVGNGPDVLRSIDAVGSDFSMVPGTCGKQGQGVPVGCGQPTLRLAGITFGGTAA